MVSQANDLALPAFAIEHLGKARVLTAIDLIVFDRVPGSEKAEDRHPWTDEFFHVMQYHRCGVDEFAKKYAGEEMGFQPAGDSVNAMEREADTRSPALSSSPAATGNRS